MYQILIRLMFIAALTQLGISLSDLRACHSRACWRQFESRSREVLRVDWRPIPVFPEEAGRFR